MELYIGGAFQGKLDYVLGKKQKNMRIADGADCSDDAFVSADILNHLHLLIQRKLQAGEGVETLIDEIYAANPQIILISDEVGCGIVPLERKDREYREAVGRILCQAAQKADCMERIFGGIGMRIK